MMEFLAMGGYAPYVWGSYLVMAGLLLVELVQLRYRRRSLVGWLKRMARLNEQEGTR
ncbi:heme exporter protein CcmD [Thioalkalivibrio paradoxus]|uniref:Heme exporter protein D n=1 Tax=Thioalkalivibrio paradoxus ARh 1 TaxID=713585 RepID=W0DQN5_9GAMM|nr:heme exporter protein CcmD [Thioalkalivibrio paradoxus]AHE98028.1 hemagglutination activity protein [Thioalkalivibrio paradoxus ARh 1]AHE99572.1 hemagglutination activity protein [Thioalkalivibrio paradoxus ARh 1]